MSKHTGSRNAIIEYLEWRKRQDRIALFWRIVAWALIIGSVAMAMLAGWLLLSFLFTV